MSALEIWLVIAGMMVVTIVACSPFLIVGDRMALPTRVQHTLRFAPIVALVAIILPDLFWNQGHSDTSWVNPRPMAGIATTALYIAVRHMPGMIFVNMGVFTALRPWG